MTAAVVPIRPVTREKVIFHVNSDEMEQAGRAFAIWAKERRPDTVWTMVTVDLSTPFAREFFIGRDERGRKGSRTIKVWSQQLDRGGDDAA